MDLDLRREGQNQVLSAQLDLVLTLTPSHLTMACFSSKAWFLGGLVLLFVTGAEAGNDTYEPTQPPRIIAIHCQRKIVLSGVSGAKRGRRIWSLLHHPWHRRCKWAETPDCRRWLYAEGARMMTIRANSVCRLQECSASPGQICYDDPTLAFELPSTRRRISAS